MHEQGIGTNENRLSIERSKRIKYDKTKVIIYTMTVAIASTF